MYRFARFHGLRMSQKNSVAPRPKNGAPRPLSNNPTPTSVIARLEQGHDPGSRIAASSVSGLLETERDFWDGLLGG
jgi:hypothetical protein